MIRILLYIGVIWFILIVLPGCSESAPKQYDLTKERYAGGNIMKNGHFNEQLLYWTLPMAEFGNYVHIINEDTPDRNALAVIHSLDETVDIPKRFYIGSIAQGFTIKRGDFQHITVRANVKFSGGVAPSIFIAFHNDSTHGEDANYGEIYFKETSHEPPYEWHTLELSQMIPDTADWLGIWCGGTPLSDNNSNSLPSEAFAVYFDDIEAILEPHTK